MYHVHAYRGACQWTGTGDCNSALALWCMPHSGGWRAEFGTVRRRQTWLTDWGTSSSSACFIVHKGVRKKTNPQAHAHKKTLMVYSALCTHTHTHAHASAISVSSLPYLDGGGGIFLASSVSSSCSKPERVFSSSKLGMMRCFLCSGSSLASAPSSARLVPCACSSASMASSCA